MFTKIGTTSSRILRSWFYQYRLCLALEVCEPWEQTIIYILTGLLFALICFAAFLFVPDQFTALRKAIINISAAFANIGDEILQND
ncbi:unnamed protein product, partial [Dicrocoelium dendriticum]